MIELGGNIFLEGFDILERAELLIAKKLVGGYVRRISDEIAPCDKVEIKLKKVEKYEVSVSLMVNDKSTKTKTNGENLFITIDSAFKKALKEINVKI